MGKQPGFFKRLGTAMKKVFIDPYTKDLSSDKTWYQNLLTFGRNYFGNLAEGYKMGSDIAGYLEWIPGYENYIKAAKYALKPASWVMGKISEQFDKWDDGEINNEGGYNPIIHGWNENGVTGALDAAYDVIKDSGKVESKKPDLLNPRLDNLVNPSIKRVDTTYQKPYGTGNIQAVDQDLNPGNKTQLLHSNNGRVYSGRPQRPVRQVKKYSGW